MLLQCHYCDVKFRSKELLSKHILSHPTDDEKLKKYKCTKCKMKCPNKVLLNRHISKVHNKNKKIKTKRKKAKAKPAKPKNFICAACVQRFQTNCELKYHIRKKHFNLTGQIPYCDLKSINQVWFERVLNTNIIVEIKKMADNYLLIRKLNENTSIKVTEMDREVFDLTLKYPINTGMKLLSKDGMLSCRLCSKVCTSRNLKKHYEEFHKQK